MRRPHETRQQEHDLVKRWAEALNRPRTRDGVQTQMQTQTHRCPRQAVGEPTVSDQAPAHTCASRRSLPHCWREQASSGSGRQPACLAQTQTRSRHTTQQGRSLGIYAKEQEPQAHTNTRAHSWGGSGLYRQNLASFGRRRGELWPAQTEECPAANEKCAMRAREDEEEPHLHLTRARSPSERLHAAGLLPTA